MGRVILTAFACCMLMAFACCRLTRPAVDGEASQSKPAMKELNGVMWQRMDNKEKVSWLLGTRDGVGSAKARTVSGSSRPQSFGKSNALARKRSRMKLKPPSALFVNTIAAVDKFYSDYKNINIPVCFAMRIIFMGIHGESEESIEKLLEKYRKAYAPKAGEAKDRK